MTYFVADWLYETLTYAGLNIYNNDKLSKELGKVRRNVLNGTDHLSEQIYEPSSEIEEEQLYRCVEKVYDFFWGKYKNTDDKIMEMLMNRLPDIISEIDGVRYGFDDEDDGEYDYFSRR